MRDLTDTPFGVTIAQALVRDPPIVELVGDEGAKLVTRAGR